MLTMNQMEQIFLPASLITIANMVMIIGGILYFRNKGGSKAAQDVIDILTKRDEEQKALIADYQLKFQELNKELGILQGTIQEQNKKIEEYMSILQGKNPEQTQYMADMRKFTEGVALYMDNSNKQLVENNKTQVENTKTLQAISKFMEELNNKSTESRAWQKKREKDIPERR